MSNLCIIPARGGSKRIPRKNIKNFFGKPIIVYSIEAALRSGLFEEVMVSTDDKEIATVAKNASATVPFMRSEKTAHDFATTGEVIEEVLNCYSIEQNKSFNFICCIYPCAPFVNPDKLSEAFYLLQKQNFDTVFPVVNFGFPIQRALKFSEGKLTFFQPEFALSRSQDLEKSYHDAGQFYWLRSKAFLKEKKVVTGNSGAIIVSDLEAQDIDNESDWMIAEIKYNLFIHR